MVLNAKDNLNEVLHIDWTGIHHHVLHEHHLRNDSYRETNQKLFSRIASDLEQWSDGISLEMVERTYCTVCFQ